MDSEKWKGFGFDMARVNADIKRRTGKWGKLKTPKEVREYLDTMEEREIPTTPVPADRAVAKPPKPRKHGLGAARVVVMRGGNASLYKANEYGIPTDIVETRPVESKAEGRAYMCADCNERFKEWGEFTSHSLANRQ